MAGSKQVVQNRKSADCVSASEAALAEQDDGSLALQLPEAAHLRCCLRVSPFLLQEDGRLHSWTMVACIRLDRLPARKGTPRAKTDALRPAAYLDALAEPGANFRVEIPFCERFPAL